MQVLC